MKTIHSKFNLATLVLGAAGLSGIGLTPFGQAATPTVRITIEQSTNRFVRINWAPPEAILRCAPTVTSAFSDLVGIAPPYAIDTRLAPQGYYRASLPVTQPRVFLWRDTIVQPGSLAIEWTPRDWRLEQSTDLSSWTVVPGVPAAGWYYPPASPAGPGTGLLALRYYRARNAGPGLNGPGGVFSVNIPLWGYFALEVGRSNYVAFMVRTLDRKVNSLLPLSDDADGSRLHFYDSAGQSFGPTNRFSIAAGGWINDAGSPALAPPDASACVVVPRSTVPGATHVTGYLFGELPVGTLSRIVPPGYSLHSPPAHLGGGISTVHNLLARFGDFLFLYRPATGGFDGYIFEEEWYSVDNMLPQEPVLGPADVFFYFNSGPSFPWSVNFNPN